MPNTSSGNSGGKMNNRMNGTKLSKIIRKCSLIFGVALLIISIYLSYDGFDGSVNGNNYYEAVAVLIGIVFACTVTVVQFIFTNEYKQLNPTLIVVGLLSYAYSIVTNKMGAEHILGMNGWMAWATAAMADVIAEPMISWGLGESLVGDLLGNLWKAISDDDKEKPIESKYNKPQYRTPAPERPRYVPQHKPEHLGMRKDKPVIQTGRDFFNGKR